MGRLTSFVKRIFNTLTNIAETKGKKITGYKSKKWISYGDSITSSNGWQPAVAKRLGLTHVNRGIGGTTITENGSIAWIDQNGNYKGQPPKPQPNGTIEILSSMCNSQRINATIPLDTQLLTIMGGTNDFGRGLPLGKGFPTNERPNLDESTFIGALCSMIEKIQTRLPNCWIILMTPVPRYHNGKYEDKNKAGYLTSDYARAVKDVATFYALPCIDLYSNVGWNRMNGEYYLIDSMHPNKTRGYKRVSEIVIGALEVLQQDVKSSIEEEDTNQPTEN
ncbi:SGNH/GDSL hydrolase family protein [Bacillus sp. UNCCL81]|uniref:SGNH/GDSL hydrolase family protein n=1 Tax=Bacillus sp. UNCCL81 TaxID=1502755 RepID=UPI0008EB2638|nr:SGNH/GDSL hydrolase family protein [Bacillus sp. UNCCL81]SFD02894.1 Lysophospholipase L1 [Bacillus sp. UNCCL81]